MDHVHKVCICLVQPTFWGVALKKLPIRVKPCQDFVQEFFRSTLPPLILLILRNSFPTKSDTHITLQSSCLTGITRWFFFFYGTGTYRSQKRESHLSRPDFGTGFFWGGGGGGGKWSNGNYQLRQLKIVIRRQIDFFPWRGVFWLMLREGSKKERPF